MTTVYCWFDWDDDTTTVNSINIIKEPRKPWMEYEQGEKVLANLPQFGLWRGVIVEISESKKDLVQKMTSRQKNAAALELNENVQHADKDNDSTESGMQKKTKRPKVTNVNTQNDEDDTNKDETSKDDKGKKKETSKKRVRDEDVSKAEEKRKKKTEDTMKLNAKNRQLEDMILERRKTNESSSEAKEDCQDSVLPLYSDLEQVPDTLQTIQSTEPFWHVQPFGSPDSAFQRYSYFGDLMSPSSSATYQSLTSQTELQDRCYRLELENEQLKKENERLRVQLERQDLEKQTEDVIATPKKVEFLRQLVASFEKKTQRVRSQQAVTRVYSPTPVRLSTPVRLPVRLTYEATEFNLPQTIQTHHLEQDLVEKSPIRQEKSHWEECVTSSGVKKVRLVPELEVYLTQGQLSQIKHAGSGNPRKMTIALLDALFSKEQLAWSSAKGSKMAHNACMQTAPLPGVTVQAIKLICAKCFQKREW